MEAFSSWLNKFLQLLMIKAIAEQECLLGQGTSLCTEINKHRREGKLKCVSEHAL